MAAVKGDTLLFQNGNTVGKVIGTGAAAGTLLVLIAATTAVASMVQANADTDLAVVAAVPALAPAIGAFVTVGYKQGTFGNPDSELWRVVGYATTAGFGAAITLMILASLNDPAQQRFVIFSGAGAIPTFAQGT